MDEWWMNVCINEWMKKMWMKMNNWMNELTVDEYRYVD